MMCVCGGRCWELRADACACAGGRARVCVVCVRACVRGCVYVQLTATSRVGCVCVCVCVCVCLCVCS